MKFNNGYWLSHKYFILHRAGCAHEAWRTADGFAVLVTQQKIVHRGQTLGGPVITMYVSSPRPNVVRVRYEHYSGGHAPKGFDLIGEAGFAPTVEIADTYASLRSGDTCVTVRLGGAWDVTFTHKGRLLTQSRGRAAAYVESDGAYAKQIRAAYTDDHPWSVPQGHDTYMLERLSVGVGEKLYGFGERFTPFVKNGQSVETWNMDGGTCSEQGYKCVPFYLSSNGYGVLVNHTGYVSYEVCSEVVNDVAFAVPGQILDYCVVGGDSPSDALRNYVALTGVPALPSPYTFGLWLTTSFTTDYSEETVTSFIDGMAQRGIPLSVFHFDCFWMREFRWCNFRWDERYFPDPAAILKRLKDRGLRISVWLNPYIAQQSEAFAECVANGYLLRKPDGGVYQLDMWQPGMAIVDFTNPAAARWYADQVKALLDMGVDCIKTDFGERIPSDAVYHDSSRGEDMHNYYSYLYNKTVHEVLVQSDTHGCLFARSATTGGQQFPVHWGGDCTAEYASMAETLRGGLSLSCSGFGYFSHDIGGFEATATPDIYKRWAAFGLLSTHSRLHGNSSYRVPWLFDDEAVDVLRHFTLLKGRLMPYLYAQSVENHRTGLPVMRPMLLDFPNDAACLNADTQYMLGDALLVAPIFNADGVARYYVPDGTWYDLQSGQRVDGARYVESAHDYFSLPVLVRPGHIVALGAFQNDFDYDYTDNLTLIVGYLRAGESATCDICDSTGRVAYTATVALDTDGVTVSGIPNHVRYTLKVCE